MAGIKGRLARIEAMMTRPEAEPTLAWTDLIPWCEGRTIFAPDFDRALHGVARLAAEDVGGWDAEYEGDESSPAAKAIGQAFTRIDELLRNGMNTQFAVHQWSYERFAAIHQDSREAAIRAAFSPLPFGRPIVEALPSMAGHKFTDDQADSFEAGFRSVATRAATLADANWQAGGLTDRIVSLMGDALAMVDDKIRKLRWSPGDAIRQWHNSEGRERLKAS